MEIGPFQRQYLDSVENPHASAAQLIAKFDELYRAANTMMAEMGMTGEINTRHRLVSAVMDALHDLDGGLPRD